jgi:nucleoside-diphosphate-sugar epimerase
MQRVLVTGAAGQIGSELTLFLRDRLGGANVVACGHRKQPAAEVLETGPFHYVDCTRPKDIGELVARYRVDTIFHLAAILSATAEKDPRNAWRVNVEGLRNVLETARAKRCAVFTPSSIAAFGPSTPKVLTPQDTIQRPNTIYGITKVTGELLCDYYFARFGVDARGVRYPGLISHRTPPGGGTTDYAVAIYFEAVQRRRYCCYLSGDTALAMMYMPDALRAAAELMETDPIRLQHRNAFNLAAVSVTPESIAAAIRRHIPDFTLDFAVDPQRQAIADSWPESVDDSAAQAEWGWRPQFDLETLTRDMIESISRMPRSGKDKQ